MKNSNIYSNEEKAGCFAFSSVLSCGDEKQIKKYFSSHRLSASEEYQMVVSLLMYDDEQMAEKIIGRYIRCFGLRSVRARQVLADMGFKKALNLLSIRQRADEYPLQEPSQLQKLCDGFMLMADDDVADRGFVIMNLSKLL